MTDETHITSSGDANTTSTSPNSTNNATPVGGDQTRQNLRPGAEDHASDQETTAQPRSHSQSSQTSFPAKQEIPPLDMTEPEEANEDTTIPIHDEQKRRLVAILTRACLAIDATSPGTAIPKVFTEGNLDLRIVEGRCWEMLGIMLQRSTTPELFTIEQRISLTDSPQMQFADRFDSTVEALLSNKVIAEKVFEPSYLVKLVDDPVGMRELNQGESKSIAEQLLEPDYMGKLVADPVRMLQESLDNVQQASQHMHETDEGAAK